MCKYKTKKYKKRGFTLIELIIVISIISIIVSIAIPKFGKCQKNAKISADMASAKNIANAVSFEIAQGNDVKNINDVKLDIQGGIPKPKAVSGDFSIKITENQDVIVNAGGKEVYPNLNKDYGK